MKRKAKLRRTPGGLVAFRPRPSVHCLLCDAEIDLGTAGSGRIHRVGEVASGLWTAVAICRACDRANNGALPLLLAIAGAKGKQ
ncbi:hypothetical protein ACKVEX_05530 [Rhodocyclaceae bacterium SMB388]